MFNIVSNRFPLHGCVYSNIGGRPENQDSFCVQETPLGLLVVISDGMGGGPGGKTASTLAVTVIANTVMSFAENASREEALKVAIGKAHEAMLAKERDVPQLVGMGATVVAVIINKQSAVVANIGDSRCYRISNGKTIFRSQDHSLVGELVRRKVLTEEQARTSPQSNVITKALGNTNDQVPDIFEICYRKGDRLVLCTDGVWGCMTNTELVMRLSAKTEVGNLTNMLAAEVDKIGFQKGGHHDNHTLAILEMDGNSIKKDSMSKTFKIVLATLSSLLFVSVVFNIVSLTKGDNDDYRAIVDDQNRQIEKLVAYEQMYKEISSNKNKDLAEVIDNYTHSRDSLEKIISTLRSELDSAKKNVQTKQDANSKLSVNGDKRGVSKEPSQIDVDNIIVALRRIKNVEGPKQNEVVKKKSQYQKEALQHLEKFSQRAKKTDVGIIKLKNMIEANTIITVEADKDKKYKSTHTATKAIDEAIKRAEALRK